MLLVDSMLETRRSIQERKILKKEENYKEKHNE
jgi:hypothetical protein